LHRLTDRPDRLLTGAASIFTIAWIGSIPEPSSSPEEIEPVARPPVALPEKLLLPSCEGLVTLNSPSAVVGTVPAAPTLIGPPFCDSTSSPY
jgi:hypothetical protein